MDEERECWVCLETADPDGVTAAPTGCACRGSAGYAHLSCLITAVQHKPAQERDSCPTCKQLYKGPMSAGLSDALLAASDLCRGTLDWGAMEDLMDFLNLAAHRANVLMESGDDEGARQIYEQLVAMARKSRGDRDVLTLQYMVATCCCVRASTLRPCR